MEVLIRYNTKSVSENDKWRLLIDAKEFICTHIKLNCPTETCMRPIRENGESINKYHIRAYNFNEIIFNYGKDQKLIVTIV